MWLSPCPFISEALRSDKLPQPKLPIVLGSAIIAVALGLVSYAMDENDKSMVNG